MNQVYCQFCDPAYIKQWALRIYGNQAAVLLCEEPVSRGHLLVVPHWHIGQMLDVHLLILRALQKAAQFAADKLQEHLQTEGFTLAYDKRNGHFKIHVIPWLKGTNPSMHFSSISPPQVPHPTPAIKRSREMDKAKAETLLEEFRSLFGR